MNDEMAGTTNSGRRRGEGVDWFVANEMEEFRRITLLKWAGWCGCHENRAKYTEVIWLRQKVGTLLRPVLPSRAGLLEDFAKGIPVVPTRLVSVRDATHLVSRSRHLLSWSRIGAIAASMSILAITTIAPLKPQGLGPPMTLDQSYASALGEQREVLLPDGSTATP